MESVVTVGRIMTAKTIEPGRDVYKRQAETLGFEIDVTPLPNEKKDDETEAEAEADAE